MDSPRFEIFPDHAGQHRWRLRAANGEIVAQSESYSSPRDAERGAEAAVRAMLEIMLANVTLAEPAAA